MFSWLILAGLVGMVAATRDVPTAEEMLASFDHGQKFYASGAYDQAIEKYENIVESRSPFLKMQKVAVTVGDISAPLQEVAPYQIGNAHLKMAEEALETAGRTRRQEDRDVEEGRARQLLEEASGHFLRTERESTVPALRALARSQMVTCYYKMKDYDRTVEAAEVLLSQYPDSKYVIQAMYDIGWAYFDQEKYEESIASFGELVDRFPSGYRGNRALFQVGEAHFRLEQFGEAIPHYQRLVESQRIGQMSEREIMIMKREKLAGLVDETALDLAAKALIRMGQCYEKTGDFAGAGQAFSTVAVHFADEQRLAEEAYLRHADMYYRRGDFEACIAVYRTAIESDPDMGDKARLQLLLANRYFETEHYDEAAAEYDVYRDTYPMWAAAAGLPVEGVGLQIARAWFKEAEGLAEGERVDPYRRAAAELTSTLRMYPGSRYDVEMRFNLGLSLQLQEDAAMLDEALAVYETVIDDPQAGGYRQSALFQAARIHHEKERHARAASLYEILLEEMADRPELDIARFEMGTAKRDGEDLEAALHYFLAVRPESEIYARARLEAGQSMIQAERLAEAIPLLEEGGRADGDGDTRALIYYFLGASHSRLGDFAAAIPAFDKCLTEDSDAARDQAHYGRGVAYFRTEQYGAAIPDLEHDFAGDEIAASAPRLLAAAYTATGRTDEALTIYQGLADQTKTALERAEHLLALAEIRYRQTSYGEVIGACQQVLGLQFAEPELPATRKYYIKEKARFLMADSHVRLEDFEAAIGAARRGLERFPKGFFAGDMWFLLGLANLQAEKNPEAAEALEALLKDYPDHSNAGYARYYYGYARFNQTHFSDARGIFGELVTRYPELDVTPDARFRRIECLFNLGEFDAAGGEYEEYIRQYPNADMAEDALYNIGWCRMNAVAGIDEASGSTEIRTAFERYLERYPAGRHAPTARYTLAEMVYNEGRYEEAYGLFQRIGTDHPGTDVARRAGEALPELREAVAYKAYEAAMVAFHRAVEADDKELLLAAIPDLEAVWAEYPETSSGIGARVNTGVIYQKLKRWEQAVEIYDSIIAAAERGGEQITDGVLSFVERRSGTIKRKHL